MIFKSPGDTQGHGDNSEISEFFGRKIPNAILPFPCSFHHNSPGAKYFFKRSVAPLCEKIIFASERSYITFAMRKSMLDMPVPGSF